LGNNLQNITASFCRTPSHLIRVWKGFFVTILMLVSNSCNKLTKLIPPLLEIKDDQLLWIHSSFGLMLVPMVQFDGSLFGHHGWMSGCKKAFAGKAMR